MIVWNVENIFYFYQSGPYSPTIHITPNSPNYMTFGENIFNSYQGGPYSPAVYITPNSPIQLSFYYIYIFSSPEPKAHKVSW